ncbi:helix-turn-helix domain-containing protein [Nocardia sp. NPDC005998]|uniref:helix-turn-helix domain-containing protein n=1 Tax=Nocardia sp. NPDC005998 TaxID=3156894 RepID=UPI0033B97145
MDSTLPDTAARGFDTYRNKWDSQLGARLPGFSSATTGDFRVRAHAVRMRDLVMVDIHGVSGIRTERPANSVEGEIQLYVVSSGAYTLDDGSGRGGYTVSAGQFLLRRLERPGNFEMQPHTTAKVIAAMSSTLEPLLRNRGITGAVESAEIRLLMAHANMVRTTLADLGPDGAHAARNALIELVKGAALGRFDDMEPRLAPALAQAAKDLADRRLADPELSPALLARELNVSMRTLQRAFAAVGESANTYIRYRRLEEARLALTASPDRPSVSELAAYWQFSDSSHFIRAFKKAYGRTPAEYARAIGTAEERAVPRRVV